MVVATDICGKSPLRGSAYMGFCENIHFQQFCLFLTFSGVFIIILILLFLLVYISFLALLALLKLILSSFLSLLFITVVC